MLFQARVRGRLQLQLIRSKGGTWEAAAFRQEDCSPQRKGPHCIAPTGLEESPGSLIQVLVEAADRTSPPGGHSTVSVRCWARAEELPGLMLVEGGTCAA